MALQDIDVPIDLTGGLDTKTDPKQVVIGKLLSLQNARYKTLNLYIKRNGYAALPTGLLGGGSISTGVGIANFQNQLNLYDGNRFYAFNESTQSWSNNGPFSLTSLTSTSIIKNFYSQTSPDFAYNAAANLSVYVWEDTQGGVRYSVIDTVTGNQIVDDAQLSSTGINPRVASIGSVFVLFYVNSGQIYYNSINTSTPETLSSATALTSDLSGTNQIYAVNTINGSAYIAYTNTSPAIALYSLSSSLVRSSQYTVGSDTETCISIASDTSYNAWVSYYTGTAVKTFVVNAALNSTVLAPTVVETVANIRNITSVVNGTTGTLFYEVSATEAYNENIRTNTITLSGTAGSASVFIRSLGLASKAFNYNGGIYVLGTYSSDLQAKYFLLNQNAQVVCRLGGEPNLGGSLTAKSLLPSVANPSTGVYTFPYLLVDEITFTQVFDANNVASEQATTQTGIQQAQIAFTQTYPSALSLGNNLNLTNGIPSIYDGNNIVEQGFNLYPENVAGGAAAINPPSLLGPIGQYNNTSSIQYLGNDTAAHNSTAILAQPFTASSNGVLDNATISLGKTNNVGGSITGSVQVYICADNAGSPGTQISDTQTIAASGIPSAAYPSIAPQSPFTVMFSTTPVLTNGVQYWLVVSAAGLSFNSSGGTVYCSMGTSSLPYGYCQESMYGQAYQTAWNQITTSPGGGVWPPTTFSNCNLIFEVQAFNSITSNPPLIGYNPIGGGLTPGEYQYSAVYSWVDNQGQKHQSAPSVAYQMDSGVNLGQYNLQIVASVSTSSPNATTNNSLGLFPGMGLVGADLTSTPPTYVTAVSSGAFTMNQDASVTSASALVKGSPSFLMTVNTSIGSNLVQVDKPTYAYIYATCNGTNVIQVDDTSWLQVGNTLVAADGSSSFPSQTITAINGGSVTLSGSVPSTVTQALQISGSTLNAAAYLRIGQVLDDDGVNILAGSTIENISANPDGTAVVTISEPALNTATGDTVRITNTVMGVIRIPTIRVTNRVGPINIDVYRTTNIGGVPGTVFYKAGSIKNDTTVDYVTFFDKSSDVQILSNTQLYTTGDVVSNIAAPPHQISVQYNNREIIIPNENLLSFWYSQQVIPGSPVEFSDSFINNLDSKGGNVTAAGVMDDKLILFKQDTIFYQVAQGPSPNGSNNDFNSGTQIVTPVGCSNQQSIIPMPSGLMFQASGNQGIWLLSRDLGVKYIGADVEGYNQYTVTSAQLVPTETVVRFTMSNGVILIYDYFVNKWGVDLNLSAIQSCVFQNVFTYLNANGTVYQETPGSYTDNGAFIPLGLTTSWLSFADLQGFQRAREFLILGQYFSPHTLNVSFAYNFNSTVVQTNAIPVSSDPNPYQFRVFLDVQKCQSVQISLLESQSGSYGQGLSLSGFNFIVGKKKGHFKMPAAASYG